MKRKLTHSLISNSGFKKLTPKKKRTICNGAGAAGDWRSILIPNSLYGLDCTMAFDIHDYDYYTGFTNKDKLLSDVHMLVNLILIIISNGGWLVTPRIYRAATYFLAVYLHGDDVFFTLSKGNINLKPRG